MRVCLLGQSISNAGRVVSVGRLFLLSKFPSEKCCDIARRSGKAFC